MTKRIIGILLIALSAFGLVVLTACDSSKPKSFSGEPRESLTLGTSANDLSALIWVAKGKGYFADHGLDINIKLYESGHLALKDMLAGNLDLATASEFAAVRFGTERPDFRIISTLDEAEDQKLVARGDRGINGPSDLRNKRIGVAKGTSSDYYLHLMLILEKIPEKEVHLMDMLPSDLVSAIAAGEIDAIAVWEPFASLAAKELGTNAVSWSGQGGEDEYWLLLSTDETLKKRSSAVRRFLAALALAEDLIKNNEPEAMRLVAQQIGDSHMAKSWKNHKFRLGLNRPLILKMESELKWMNSKSGKGQSEIPDLLNFLYPDGLIATKPDSVKILIGKQE